MSENGEKQSVFPKTQDDKYIVYSQKGGKKSENVAGANCNQRI